LDDVQYDFVGGEAMRRVLLDSLPRNRIEQVQEIVSRYVDENLDQLETFRAALYVPGATGNVAVNSSTRYIAQVSASVLRYLGGAYAEAAEQLERAIEPGMPFVRHQKGVPLWVATTLPRRVDVVNGKPTLSVRIYVQSDPSHNGGPDTIAHSLAELRP